MCDFHPGYDDDADDDDDEDEKNSTPKYIHVTPHACLFDMMERKSNNKKNRYLLKQK